MKMEDKNMKLVELCTAFWDENEYENFSTSQMALYFFLLNRSYKRNWIMPIKCPSANLCRATGMSEEALNSARKGLQKRGLITFTKGNGRLVPPMCCLIMDPHEWHDTQIESQDEPPRQEDIGIDSKTTTKKTTKKSGKNKGVVSRKLTTISPDSDLGNNISDNSGEDPDKIVIDDTGKKSVKSLFELSGEDKAEVADEPLPEPPLKNYVKSISKKEVEFTDDCSGANQGDNQDKIADDTSGEFDGEKTVKPIDEIEKIILADEKWLRSKYAEIYPDGNLPLDEMKTLVNRFFQYIRNEKKYHEREEEDCRNHCINWIRLKLKNSTTQ